MGNLVFITHEWMAIKALEDAAARLERESADLLALAEVMKERLKAVER